LRSYGTKGSEKEKGRARRNERERVSEGKRWKIHGRLDNLCSLKPLQSQMLKVD